METAELVLGVHQNQSVTSGNLLTAGKQRQGVLLHLLVLGFGHQAAGDNLLARDVLVVGTDLGLGGRGDDGRGELLVLAHAFRQTDTADLAYTGLVGAPGRAAEIAADNHLDGIALAAIADRHHRVGSGLQPVGADVAGGVQELGRNLIEDLSLVGDAFGQDYIECRDAVRSHHAELFVTQEIHVTHFAVIDFGLSGKGEVGFC